MKEITVGQIEIPILLPIVSWFSGDWR
jgi:hypothetical protein